MQMPITWILMALHCLTRTCHGIALPNYGDRFTPNEKDHALLLDGFPLDENEFDHEDCLIGSPAAVDNDIFLAAQLYSCPC